MYPNGYSMGMESNMNKQIEKYVVREVPTNPKTADEVGPWVCEFRGADAWEQAVAWVAAQPQPRRYEIHLA
jgi:hypothetical protein